MKVIKLDAIDSTNEFLKRFLNEQQVENYTVVTAEHQTKGKGQMGAVWESDTGKNLIMSVLIKDCISEIHQIFHLNIIVSLSVIQVLEHYRIPKLSIKWPNDIMSDTKKIGGILIENSIKNDGTIFSVVGLGLNCNQTQFEQLPRASSLAVVTNQLYDKEELMLLIVDRMKKNSLSWQQQSAAMWEHYTTLLFKKGVPMPFQGAEGQNFMGIIQGVSSAGKLQILLEDDSIAEFDTKEVQLLY